MHDIEAFEREQEQLRQYCLQHKIVRPPQQSVALVVVLFVFLIMVLSIVIFLSYMTTWSLWINVEIGLSVGIFFVARRVSIIAIKLYQRYAPEEKRRKCICRPSCSEYAIAVLQKYGLFKGWYKIYVRLIYTCRGNVYRIDEP